MRRLFCAACFVLFVVGSAVTASAGVIYWEGSYSYRHLGVETATPLSPFRNESTGSVDGWTQYALSFSFFDPIEARAQPDPAAGFTLFLSGYSNAAHSEDALLTELRIEFLYNHAFSETTKQLLLVTQYASAGATSENPYAYSAIFHSLGVVGSQLTLVDLFLLEPLAKSDPNPDPAPTPEPASMLLMALGLSGLVAYRRVRARKP